MFENPGRGRKARNFTTNVPKILALKSSSEQIFSENWRWMPLACRELWLQGTAWQQPDVRQSWLVLFPEHSLLWSHQRWLWSARQLFIVWDTMSVELRADIFLATGIWRSLFFSGHCLVVTYCYPRGFLITQILLLDDIFISTISIFTFFAINFVV